MAVNRYDSNPNNNAIIFGSPYRFLESVDPGLTHQDDDGYGETSSSFIGDYYKENYESNIPILTLRVGKPQYTGDIQQETIVSALGIDGSSSIFESDSLVETLQTIFAINGSGLTRYYSFFGQYWEYIKFVSFLTYSFATYIGLDTENVKIPVVTFTKTTSNNIQISSQSIAEMNWATYTSFSKVNESSNMVSLIEIFTKKSKASEKSLITNESALESTYKSVKSNIKDFKEDTNYTTGNAKVPGIIQFAVDAINMSESFGNSITTSILDPSSVEDQYTNEIQFLTGGATDNKLVESLKNGIEGVVGAVPDSITSKIQSVSSTIQNLSPSLIGAATNYVSGIIKGLQGEHIIIPQIYKSSEYTRLYSLSTKLTATSAHPLVYFKQILIPLSYLIPLALPKATSSNAYGMPFLVQAYVPGQFACGLGIVSQLSITRGSDNSDFNSKGFAMSYDIKIDIKDLYNEISMTPIDRLDLAISNISYIEYVASYCNNILYKSDTADGIYNNILTYTGQKATEYLTTSTARSVAEDAIMKIMKITGLGYSVSGAINN